MKGRGVVCRSSADRGWLVNCGWHDALTAVRNKGRRLVLRAGAKEGKQSQKDEGGSLKWNAKFDGHGGLRFCDSGFKKWSWPI